MDNPLLAALQSNYGDGTLPPPDPTTVRGLLAFCKLWLENETDTEDLHNPCMEMSGRLKAGAKAQTKEIRQNPNLVEARRAPLVRQVEAYRTIAEVLDRLPTLAANDDVDAFHDAVDIFEDERQVVLDCNAEIEESMSGKYRLCPRCGDRAESDFCDKCQVIRLYPDPRATEYDRSKTAVLPPVYGRVSELYGKVMGGDLSLPALIEGVTTLENYLLELQVTYEQTIAMEPQEDEEAADFKEGQELARKLSGQVGKALSGIERIRSAGESFRMADLSRGWDTIFDAAVNSQRATQRFAKLHGLIDSDQEDSDTIQIGGD